MFLQVVNMISRVIQKILLRCLERHDSANEWREEHYVRHRGQNRELGRCSLSFHSMNDTV